MSVIFFPSSELSRHPNPDYQSMRILRPREVDTECGARWSSQRKRQNQSTEPSRSTTTIARTVLRLCSRHHYSRFLSLTAWHPSRVVHPNRVNLNTTFHLQKNYQETKKKQHGTIKQLYKFK